MNIKKIERKNHKKRFFFILITPMEILLMRHTQSRMICAREIENEIKDMEIYLIT